MQSYSLPRDILYSAYRLSMLHAAPDGSSKTTHGTCFFVKADSDLYVITNKHNLFIAYADEKYIGYKLDGIMISGYFGIDQYAECDWRGQTISFAVPDNNEEDVVVVRATGISFRFMRKRLLGEDTSIKTTSLNPINIESLLLGNDEDMRQLNPGDPIAFPSYPELFDQNGVRPIMRIGSIASDPVNDYQSIGQPPARRVVFEAHSTEGSSGGPVFALKNTGELVLLGVNAGHLTANEPKIGTIHAGLSFCFKAACILEAIKKLKASTQQT